MNASTKERENELENKKICRFCLTQQSEKLLSIYTQDVRVKATAALAIQIMAITSIEVYDKDGMPRYICTDCRILFEHSYRFKQMCKQADMLLRQYPLTGNWPEPLEKPRAPLVVNQQQKLRNLIKSESKKSNTVTLTSTAENSNKSNDSPIKLLNKTYTTHSNSAANIHLTCIKAQPDAATIFLNKVENDEELSMEDVKNLMAATNEHEEFLSTNEVILADTEEGISTYAPESPDKPKLLNKSLMRILNKEANTTKEPRLRKPQLTCDEEGKAVFVTQILDPNEPYEVEPEPDPIKDAVPVETNVYPCPQCHRSFPLRQLRDIHMVNHNRERCFKCTHCDKSFFSKYDLQKHSLTHTGERPFKCHVCEKAFTRATLLHRHEKTHTDIPKFICVYCEKQFISRQEMEKHSERHEKNRPFKCKLCSKSFAFKQGLERHEITHSSDLPHPCQYCNQSFFTPGKLARHLTAHAGKRAYPCKYCSKSYLLSHHLTRHLRSHKQAATPFSCTMCKNVFKTYPELIQHSIEHAAETLVCPICRQDIDAAEKLETHFREHTDSEAFACEFCDLMFMSSLQLHEHIKAEHSVDMVPYQKDEDQVDLETNQTNGLTVDEFVINDKKLIGVEILEIKHIKPIPMEIINESEPKNKKPKTKHIDNEGKLIDDTTSAQSDSLEQSMTESTSIAENERNTQSIKSVLDSLPKSLSVHRTKQQKIPIDESSTSPIPKTSATSETKLAIDNRNEDVDVKVKGNSVKKIPRKAHTSTRTGKALASESKHKKQ